MRENRTYGSEGGEGQPFPTPIGTPGPRALTLQLVALGLARSVPRT
jgi:hypothetical protein